MSMTRNTMTPNQTKISHLMNRDVIYFEAACNAARLSNYKTRVGAILVKNGNVAAVAVNYVRNVPGNVPLHQIGTHAEEAIVSMCSNSVLERSTIYVARINRAGNPLDSRPCDSRCWPLLHDMGIKYVVYSWKGRLIKERM